ncbi:MAG: hypothetical protein JEZ08_16540 [Clostridiales bacterium]|nr:hypothetical protein [Clostridiales bacterium]
MIYDINPFLGSQKEAIEEIIMIVELYTRDKLSASAFEQLITDFLKLHFKLLVDTISEEKVKIKGTAKQKLGKKRIILVSKCLERNSLAELENIETGVFKLSPKPA